jgi:hypothetical protein
MPKRSLLRALAEGECGIRIRVVYRTIWRMRSHARIQKFYRQAAAAHGENLELIHHDALPKFEAGRRLETT